MIEVRTKVNLEQDGYMDIISSMSTFLNALPKRSWDAGFDSGGNVNDTRQLHYILKFKHEQDAIAFKLKYGEWVV